MMHALVVDPYLDHLLIILTALPAGIPGPPTTYLPDDLPHDMIR